MWSDRRGKLTEELVKTVVQTVPNIVVAVWVIYELNKKFDALLEKYDTLVDRITDALLDDSESKLKM